MTVTIDQARRGAMRYADNEVIPHLPGGKGIGAGIMLALIMEGSREKILALRENPAVKMMQIFDDTGNIDLDKLYNAARPRFENKLTVSVPLLGDSRHHPQSNPSHDDKITRALAVIGVEPCGCVCREHEGQLMQIVRQHQQQKQRSGNIK